MDPNANFQELGGTSLNLFSAVLKLQENGYDVTLEQFMGGENLRKLFLSTTGANDVDEKKPAFSVSSISASDRHNAQKLIADSFAQKCELFYKCSKLTTADSVDTIVELCEKWWDTFREYSFAIVDKNGEMRGFALAADSARLATVSTEGIHPHFVKITELLRSASEPVVKKYNPSSLPRKYFLVR